MDKISSEEDLNADSSPDSPGNSKDNALFKPKPQPKVIRVLTVLAYILSVSMAAILLSIYYIFMWDEQIQTGARKAAPPHQLQLTTNLPNFTTLPSVSGPEATLTVSPEILLEDGLKAMQHQVQQSSSNVEDSYTSTNPPAISTTTSDFNTPSYEFDSLEKNSIFIKKLMADTYPYAEND